jgi:hypothetical protein
MKVFKGEVTIMCDVFDDIISISMLPVFESQSSITPPVDDSSNLTTFGEIVGGQV